MHRSSVPLFWRLKESKYKLIGTKCATCSELYFPPRQLCPKCRRDGKIEPFQFSGNGEIVSYTIIRTAPSGFEKLAPYVVAIVKLEEGPQISGQIVGDKDTGGCLEAILYGTVVVLMKDSVIVHLGIWCRL